MTFSDFSSHSYNSTMRFLNTVVPWNLSCLRLWTCRQISPILSCCLNVTFIDLILTIFFCSPKWTFFSSQVLTRWFDAALPVINDAPEIFWSLLITNLSFRLVFWTLCWILLCFIFMKIRLCFPIILSWIHSFCKGC